MIYLATAVIHLNRPYSDTGRPGIATRFVIGLLLLKRIYGLSDEEVCKRWVYDPYERSALFLPCPRGRMHRQGEGISALRTRRQGLDRHHQRLCPSFANLPWSHQGIHDI